jgi:hypothetical protein
LASFSGEHSQPTSSALERDARLVSGHAKVSAIEIAMGVIVGRTSEFFDYFVYGIGSVLAFPYILFPNTPPVTATLYSFAIFPLAFIARPIGSVIFMTVDRRYGRGVKLTSALFLLGGSTVLISFLPEYKQVGWLAIVLLAVFRFCQGLALGGAWDGLASLLALNAPQRHRGWFAMIPQLGAPLGFLLASALFLFLEAYLSRDDFLDWGWRYPFFVAFAVNVVALFARLRLVATPEFVNLLEKDELQPTPVAEMLRSQWYNVVIGAFVPLASYALFHLVTVFPLAWIGLNTDRSPVEVLTIQIAGGFIALVFVTASGMIADITGRRPLLAVAAALIAVFSFFTPLMLRSGVGGDIAFICLGFALLGLSLGQAAGSVSSNFPLRFRYTGSALVSDLAWLTGAGFAPLVALGLSSQFGLVATGAYLLSGAICTLGALLVNKQLEIRDQPG